ncbi:Ig-like domain-containing protein [Balneolales bacterium ANBcel1]|nr:Ig-like domain-containing protein [Balneolales bacterium ANBcel1]
MKSVSFVPALCFFLLILTKPAWSYHGETEKGERFPFSTDSTHITIWNGESYTPLFIKGINLGVAVPGTFPGQLAATRQDYRKWFRQIRDAGFNTLRIYTLHFPRFYEELKVFNEANPNHPLLLFQGVWLEEEVAGYNNDLYTLTDRFDGEIRENIRSVHGDTVIAERRGKAYGNYTADVSEWVIGYIIGREIHPQEILYTNENHASNTAFSGTYLSIEDVNASETWIVERMDYLLGFEWDHYQTQRPVSVSSWPTLDPLNHPFERNEHEVMASIRLRHLDFSAAPAGVFASYHAYPYYPNYISRDPKYTPFHDHMGQNSYLGYLTHLNRHYDRFPLIIAEFGGSSSWGVAQYAHNGIHHGGYSEREQGEANVRLLKNIAQAGTGGGIQFAWIDEWFKRTWITDPLDFDIERRIIWHNAAAAEQNFGLIGYRKPDAPLSRLETFCDGCPVESVDAGADFAYLKLQLNIPAHIGESDTVWVGLDTYERSLGESLLPNGVSVENRAEFVLMITNYKAELLVARAYDTFGIWHGVSGDDQLYRSVVSDGGHWNLVRWKNDDPGHEVQDIGSLRINRLDLPRASNDGVRLFDDRIEIRLPWHLLNITDPSRHQVLHDDRNTAETETRTSDGVALSISYGDFFAETSGRFKWAPWNHALEAEPYQKESYRIMKEYLPVLPGNPVANADIYEAGVGGPTIIPAESGVLANDLSLDGTRMQAVMSHPPEYGAVLLQEDGSFTYYPDDGFSGIDGFRYRVRAGANWSDPVGVTLRVEGQPTGRGFASIYPNPAPGNFTVTSPAVIDRIDIFSVLGQRLYTTEVNSNSTQIRLSDAPAGVYLVRIHSAREHTVRKLTLIP